MGINEEFERTGEWEEQQMPTPNRRESIQSMVRADLLIREQVGISRYGTALQAHNGRDALRDLYEELLDGACYVRQAMEERKMGIVMEEPAREFGGKWDKTLIAILGLAILVVVFLLGATVASGGQDANGGAGGGTTPGYRVQPSPYGFPPSNRGQVPDPGLRPSPEPGTPVDLPRVLVVP